MDSFGLLACGPTMPYKRYLFSIWRTRRTGGAAMLVLMSRKCISSHFLPRTKACTYLQGQFDEHASSTMIQKWPQVLEQIFLLRKIANTGFCSGTRSTSEGHRQRRRYEPRQAALGIDHNSTIQRSSMKFRRELEQRRCMGW